MGDLRDRKIRDAVIEMLQQRSIDEFRAGELASTVRSLVGADTATIVDVGERPSHGVRLAITPADIRPSFSIIPYDLRTLMSQHPVHDYLLSTLTLQPARVTDVTGLMQWRRSIPRSMLSHYIGARYQLTIPITVSARSYTAVNLYRGTRDFTEHDDDTAARIQPVLIGLHSITQNRRTQRHGKPESREPDALTPRQLEVLQALAQSLTPAAIAHRLGISPHTVARHVEAIYARLGTHDRVGMILAAHRLGLLDT